MKKQLLLIAFIALLPVFGCAQTTFVLSMGVSNYGDESANLHNPSKDAKAIADLFRKQKDSKVSVVTSSNVTQGNIKRHLEAIQQLAKPQDKVIVFFSGHGTQNNLVFHDGLFNFIDLIDLLKQMKTKKIFVFIDACRSGSVTNSTPNYEWNGEKAASMSFMMGCRAEEYSFENQWLDNGFFTQALILALRGKADTNKDRKITLMEAFKYVHKDVSTRESRQHPQLIASSSLYDEVLTAW